MPDGAAPARADARRNRARLVVAARELFEEVGTADAAMNDVARRAGVGPGTLWRHFPNKDALVAEVVGESLDDLDGLARDLRDDPDPGAALHRWASELVRHVGRYRGLVTSLACAADADSPLAARSRTVEAAAAALVQRALEEGRVRADVTVADVVRLATGVVWAAEAAGEPGAAGRLLDLAFDGLRTHP
ncbi:MAG TPA: helix-turn-helix domain-containing protein [Pseudonocardia sp.]|nr:helix-turn-helix domain-containing protein [Pseudonocardia sp.]